MFVLALVTDGRAIVGRYWNRLDEHPYTFQTARRLLHLPWSGRIASRISILLWALVVMAEALKWLTRRRCIIPRLIRPRHIYITIWTCHRVSLV